MRLELGGRGFRAALRGPAFGQARSGRRRGRDCRRHRRRRARPRRRGALGIHAALRPARHRGRPAARRRGRDRSGREERRAGGARCAETRARPDRGVFICASGLRTSRYVDALGVELGARWTAIEAVGIYVPGGTASYPSSVLMNAVPAKVAGVERLVMTVPSPQGRLNPLVLAAARLAGVDEIYRVGGAQAIAALAYGTEKHRPGRQDRRPGERLRRGGQAAGLRDGRHRHDRRAFGGPRRRRFRQRPGLDRRGPARAGGARHRRPGDPRHRRRGPRRSRRARGGAAARQAAARRDRALELARFRRDHPRPRPRRKHSAGQPHRARASGARRRGSRGTAARRSAMPARSFSAAIRRR